MSSRNIIVVKVGTNVLADTTGKRQKLRSQSFRTIANDIRRLSKLGHNIIVVSSAGITAGALEEGIDRYEVKDTVEEQRLAARGWDLIGQQWKKALAPLKVSSALITKTDLENIKSSRQLVSVIECCLGYGDIFLVNENDCLTDSEIKFGDNDLLSASLAKLLANSLNGLTIKLVLLTSAPGLLRDTEDERSAIRLVDDVKSIKDFARDSNNPHSRGGMTSKLMAAETALSAGIDVYITHGRKANTISKSLRGEIGTHFRSKSG